MSIIFKLQAQTIWKKDPNEWIYLWKPSNSVLCHQKFLSTYGLEKPNQRPQKSLNLDRKIPDRENCHKNLQIGKNKNEMTKGICVSFKWAQVTASPQIFLEMQKILADLKMLTEGSSTILDV